MLPIRIVLSVLLATVSAFGGWAYGSSGSSVVYVRAVEPPEAVKPIPMLPEATIPPETTVPPEPEPEPEPTSEPEPASRSLAWWTALAVCETGHDPPTNEWRTGYLGLEAGYPIGHLSWDEQLAWAVDIYSRYGDSAWGCAPRAWQAVPTG